MYLMMKLIKSKSWIADQYFYPDTCAFPPLGFSPVQVYFPFTFKYAKT